MRRTDVGSKEHLEEGSDKVVDPLYVATRGMSNGPYVKYPLETLL